MHASNDKWKANNPGGLDRNNLFFIPEEFDEEMPLIRKYTGDIPKSLVRFRHTPKKHQAVHFFLDDYRFECIWNRPNVYSWWYLDKTILSPDFSIYTNYPRMVQKWNTYRNRWIGAYFQSCKVNVIPCVTWGNEKSFDFCFKGVEAGSVVAVSTRGAGKFKEEFTRGFDEMVRQLSPMSIICGGDISKVYVGKNDLSMVINYILERPSYCYRRI